MTAQAGSYTEFEENSSVNSGTDGGHSDIGVLSDFSDYEVDPRYTPEMLEEIRRINKMGFRSDEDEYTPQWEHAFQHTIAAYVDISDIDFPNGEHSEFVDRRVTESVTAQTESNPNFPSGEYSEFFDQPVTESVTARAADTEHILMMHVSTVTTEQSERSDTDVPSGEDSEFIDRPVTELVTAQVRSNTDFPNGEHSEFVDRPVTESVTVQTESNPNFPSEEDSVFFGRPVTESVTAWAAETEQISVMNVSMVTTEQSELSDTDVPSGEDSEFIDQPVTELVTAPAGSNTDFPNGEHSEFADRPVTESVTV